MQEKTKSIPFKENFIFVILFMFLFFGFCVSFFPEENVVKWLIINGSIAFLATIVNYIIWIYQKHDSKRYHSLTSFVMLIGLTYYCMSPVFKILYPSKNFWLLLVLTMGYTIILFINRIKIAREIINPREIRLKMVFYIFAIVIIIISLVLSRIIYFANSDLIAITAGSIILYLIGLVFLSFTHIYLITPKMAKKFENMHIE